MFHAETLAEWLSHLEALHPRGQAGIELGLGRVRRVSEAMGLSPRLPMPSIIVAGTNGKGSSVAMLEAVLRTAGHRVGAYTSPHLLRYNERVRLDGEPVADDLLLRGLARVEAARAGIPLTFFEFGTLAALAVFLEARVDAVILEVGMGGRLDAVNVVDADAALITQVALDHLEWLGPDRESIGREKAGILRPGQWAVIAEADAPQSVLAHAETLGLDPWRRGIHFELARAQDHWRWRGPGRDYALPFPALAGGHQLDNAAGVVMLLEGLREALPWRLEHLREGLTRVRHPGRLQCSMQGGVRVWFDVAHNPAGAAALARAMRELPATGRTLAVFAALADKDALGMAQAMAGEVHAWFVAGLSGPRGRDAASLVELLAQAGLPVSGAWPEPSMAYNAALGEARPGDRLLVFGSFLCVAGVLDHIHPSHAGV